MAGSLKTLTINVRKLNKKIEDFTKEVSVDVAIAIIKDLVMVTPVDTSKALSNWQVSLGSKISNDAEINPHVAGIGGSSFGASANITINNAINELREKKPNEPIYISNVVDYIINLDSGSSSQFSGGFTDRTVLIASKKIEGIKIKV